MRNGYEIIAERFDFLVRAREANKEVEGVALEIVPQFRRTVAIAIWLRRCNRGGQIALFSDAPNNACIAVESYELSALMSSEASDGCLVPNTESSENIGPLESHRFPLARLPQLRSNPQKSPTHVDLTLVPNVPVNRIGIIGT